MKTINRWIIKDLLTAIAEGALLFTFIFLLKRIYDLTDLFVTGGTTLLTTLQLLSSILPTIMLMTFPMAILLGSLMVYGRMAQDNELTALQAAGYTTRQLVIPALILGFALTCLLFWWGHRIAPKGIRLFEAKAADILQNTTTGILPGHFNRMGPYIIVPNSIDEDNQIMRNVRLFQYKRESGTIPTVISAPTGTIQFHPRENIIKLNLKNGNIFQQSPGEQIMRIDFNDFNFSIGINNLLRELAQASRREEYKYTGADLKFAANHLPPDKNTPEYRWGIRSRIELARRTSLPCACLIMAVLGALLGILSGRGKRSSCYAMTISIIFVYYILLNFGKSFAETQTLPAMAGLWIPNVTGMLIAGFLYYKTTRV